MLRIADPSLFGVVDATDPSSQESFSPVQQVYGLRSSQTRHIYGHTKQDRMAEAALVDSFPRQFLRELGSKPGPQEERRNWALRRGGFGEKHEHYNEGTSSTSFCEMLLGKTPRETQRNEWIS